MAEAVLVNARMREWGIDKQPRRFQVSVRRVLSELDSESLYCLKDPRLQVTVVPRDHFNVWAYFPVHRRRPITLELRPKASTRVLLVFSGAEFEQGGKIRLANGRDRDRAKWNEACLRDHLGHTLLYLRDPKARNECRDAMKEWRASVRVKRTPSNKAADKLMGLASRQKKA